MNQRSLNQRPYIVQCRTCKLAPSTNLTSGIDSGLLKLPEPCDELPFWAMPILKKTGPLTFVECVMYEPASDSAHMAYRHYLKVTSE